MTLEERIGDCQTMRQTLVRRVAGEKRGYTRDVNSMDRHISASDQCALLLYSLLFCIFIFSFLSDPGCRIQRQAVPVTVNGPL